VLGSKVRVGLTCTDIKDIIDNHARTLANLFNPPSRSLCATPNILKDACVGSPTRTSLIITFTALWLTSSTHFPSVVQVQLSGMLHPNILKGACVGLAHIDIKDIINNHACTLVDFFSPLPISRASQTS
jgi:hypothetical protein